MFDVDDYEQFVTVQSETSLRHLANQYPYDDYKQDTISLRGNADEVRDSLQVELQSAFRPAGIEILETRLTHLAYAPEIAEVMLRRQQAEAILAARKTMVRARSASCRWRSRSSPTQTWSSSTPSARRRWCQPDGRALGRPLTHPGDQHRHALHVKPARCLRANISCSDSTLACSTRLRRWADDDLRSINAQIEYLLTDQARRAGRLPRQTTRRPPQDTEDLGDAEAAPAPSADDDPRGAGVRS